MRKDVLGKMEIDDAMQRLKEKLSSDVTVLVDTHEGGITGDVGRFDGNSFKGVRHLEQHDPEGVGRD